MGDKSWKAWERRIAAYLGPEAKRRGADFGGRTGGKDDVIHSVYSVEAKLLSKPTFGLMLEACRQAEANAEEGKIPVAVVKKKRSLDMDALVVMRLERWLQAIGE